MSSSKPRKRFTVIASSEGIEKAEKALIRLGFDSKIGFAKSQLISPSAVTKFFNCDPIQPDTFKRICDGLQLKWGEILDPDSTLGVLKQNRVSQSGIAERSVSTVSRQESMQPVARQVTVVDQQNEVEAVIVLNGDITSIDASFKSTLEVLLKSYAGCTIQVTDIQPGSIRITIKGDQAGIERLIEQFAVAKLNTLDGFPVENIYLREELSAELEESESLNKWNFIQKILSSPREKRKLQNTDLSDADLSSADLKNVNLRRSDLSSADLSSAKLSSADLSSADLSSANLHRSDLSSADLSNANLKNSELNSANLRNADLRNADLSGANLRNANLCGANLTNANLCGANLHFADLRNAIINEETQLDAKWRLVWQLVNEGAIGADLRDADLTDADLRNADLTGANLSNADLTGANLSNADLNGANFNSANLRFANLRFANLRFADFRNAIINEETQLDVKWRLVWKLTNEEASDTNLRGTDLSNANLRDANLRRSDLSGADLRNANLRNTNLRNANLRDADLRDANLRDAGLSGANLSGANLSGANLSGTNLRDANLSGANLSGAIVLNARFGEGLGISKEEQQSLAEQGATFDDALGDRGSTYSPIRR